MGTLKTWRKAYGALKDTTKVGLAHVNSDYADLDVAIVKATNHVECPPKDRHLRKVLIATGVVRPRGDIAYCIHALARRLAKTHNWTVALKTLIVIHRLLRDGDPTFREELLNYSRRSRVLQLSNFKDDSSPIAWDCSAWVRTYALFLEERLECFKTLKYDIEAERPPRPCRAQDLGYSQMSNLGCRELLEQLHALQNLLYRLMGCRPEGAAVGNVLIQYALALVLKESFKIYCAINDGLINLVDIFFKMSRDKAVKALEVYKRAVQQAINLSDFYEVCKGLELGRNFQFPLLREPPQSFIATMEEYISEAPPVVSVPTEPLLTYKPETSDEEDSNVPVEEDHERLPLDSAATSTDVYESASVPSPVPQINNLDTGDLLGLNDDVPDPFSLEEKNAIALAIVTTEPDATASVFGPGASHTLTEFDPSGWELALVTAPSTDISSATERQWAGGLDTLTLNSLYDEGTYKESQQPVYGAPAPNPFAVEDPFSISNGIAPVSTTPMDVMSQQQQQQSNPFAPFLQPPPASTMFPQQPPPVYSSSQPLMITGGPSNPFEDPTGGGFGVFPPPPSHGGGEVQQQNTNPFGLHSYFMELRD